MSAADEAVPLSAASFHILLALAEGERHGYALIKDIEAETGGTIRLGTGTLYRIIRQLLDDGWIAESARVDPDPRRRFYRLTPRGRDVARAEARRLSAVVTLAQQRRLLPSRA
jgi:DNA-binding PadR family transcriptional regulator